MLLALDVVALQGFSSPRLAVNNEGMIVLRHGEVLALLARMRTQMLRFDAVTFVEHFNE